MCKQNLGFRPSPYNNAGINDGGRTQASYKSCMPPQLHYFDCYDTEDDTIFIDCLEDLPCTFHKTYIDKLTGYNQATSLQGTFVSNNVAAVSDLDNALCNVSVSDTSKTKVDNMNCSNVPEKEIIPPSSMDYLQLITKLKIKLSKKKNISSSSKK